MNALDQIQEISDKVNAVRDIAGTIEDCPEAYMAEMRVDIQDMQSNLAILKEIIESQEAKFYNYKVGITILAIFTFISYIL